ncbi:hypothetical protein TNCV_3573491 [Trichonephila clavipes]|nr:hypothetical protein TNCV_3573491 [Trichonephila clavipes]
MSRRSVHLNSAFALQRDTTPTSGVMVWDVIAYDTRTPLNYDPWHNSSPVVRHDILQPHVLPLIGVGPPLTELQTVCDVGWTHRGHEQLVMEYEAILRGERSLMPKS